MRKTIINVLEACTCEVRIALKVLPDTRKEIEKLQLPDHINCGLKEAVAKDLLSLPRADRPKIYTLIDYLRGKFPYFMCIEDALYPWTQSDEDPVSFMEDYWFKVERWDAILINKEDDARIYKNKAGHLLVHHNKKLKTSWGVYREVTKADADADKGD